MDAGSSSNSHDCSQFADPEDPFNCVRVDEEGNASVMPYTTPYEQVGKREFYSEELFLVATIVH